MMAVIAIGFKGLDWNETNISGRNRREFVKQFFPMQLIPGSMTFDAPNPIQTVTASPQPQPTSTVQTVTANPQPQPTSTVRNDVPQRRARNPLIMHSVASQRLLGNRHIHTNARRHANKWRSQNGDNSYWRDCIDFADRNSIAIGAFGRVLVRWPTTRMRNHLPKVLQNIFTKRGDTQVSLDIPFIT